MPPPSDTHVELDARCLDFHRSAARRRARDGAGGRGVDAHLASCDLRLQRGRNQQGPRDRGIPARALRRQRRAPDADEAGDVGQRRAVGAVERRRAAGAGDVAGNRRSACRTRSPAPRPRSCCSAWSSCCSALPSALAASALWALDVNAIAISRHRQGGHVSPVLLPAGGVVLRARRSGEGAADPSAAQRWYAASGASFGLMLASKYMPQYLGIYALFNTLTDGKPGAQPPRTAAGISARWRPPSPIANVGVFFPDTWRYCVAYVQGGMLVHHGNPYARDGSTSPTSPCRRSAFRPPITCG